MEHTFFCPIFVFYITVVDNNKKIALYTHCIAYLTSDQKWSCAIYSLHSLLN